MIRKLVKGEWKGGDSGINTLMNEGFLTKRIQKTLLIIRLVWLVKQFRNGSEKAIQMHKSVVSLEDLADDLMLTSKYWTRSTKEVEQSAREQQRIRALE